MILHWSRRQSIAPTGFSRGLGPAATACPIRRLQRGLVPGDDLGVPTGVPIVLCALANIDPLATVADRLSIGLMLVIWPVEVCERS